MLEAFFQQCASACNLVEFYDFCCGVEGTHSAADIEEVTGQAGLLAEVGFDMRHD